MSEERRFRGFDNLRWVLSTIVGLFIGVISATVAVTQKDIAVSTNTKNVSTNTAVIEELKTFRTRQIEKNEHIIDKIDEVDEKVEKIDKKLDAKFDQVIKLILEKK